MDEQTKAIGLQIAELASQLKYYEWSQIAHVIEKKFKTASSRVTLTQEDAAGVKLMVKRELW